MNRTTSFFKTELLAHVNSSLELPKDFNCHMVDVVVRGQVNAIEKATIGPRCLFSLETEDDKLDLVMKRLVIQTEGEMRLTAKNGEVTVEGTSLDIRGGARVSFQC